MLEAVVFHGNILILVEKVVYFKLQFGGRAIFSAKLIFKFDQFVLKLNPQLPLVVEVVFQLVFILLEFFPLIFEHELDFVKIVIFERSCLRSNVPR